jgi:hypothetical protein
MKHKYLFNPTIEQILEDILVEYAMGEIKAENLDSSRKNYNEELNNIKVGYELNNKRNKIIEYGAYNIKLNIQYERDGARRYDWDSITYKDNEGKLLDHIATYIISDSEIEKSSLIKKSMNQIEENIYRYYKCEFEEKVEQAKIDYSHCNYF